ncbi:hypothetical protein HK098_005747, partial [Nowakowskiella sp. JEL0407]
MSSQLQLPTPAERSQKLAQIQKAIANMTAGEYAEFKQKIRSRYQQQQLLQQSQAQLPHELSALVQSTAQQLDPLPQQYLPPELASQMYKIIQSSSNYSDNSVPSFTGMCLICNCSAPKFLNLTPDPIFSNLDIGTSPFLSSGLQYQSNQYLPSPDSLSQLQNMTKQNAEFLSPYMATSAYLQSLNQKQNPDVSSLNWNDSLAAPIFPGDTNDQALSMLASSSSQKKTHNFPVDFSRFDLLPSPLSAYTPSPAWTNYESNASEFDPTEGAMFPISVDASPYLTNLQDQPIADAPPSLFENVVPAKSNTHEIPELTYDSPVIPDNSLKLKNKSAPSPYTELAGLSINGLQEDTYTTYNDAFNPYVFERIEFTDDATTPSYGNTERKESSGFVYDQVDDNYNAKNTQSSSDEETERRIKIEPEDYYDAPLIKMEYDDYDSDEIAEPGHYGEKRLPGTSPRAVKTEYSDEFTELTESEEKKDQVSDEDDDFEMQSDVYSESEAEFSESSDDEFSSTPKTRRKSNASKTLKGGLKVSTANIKISKSNTGTYVCSTCSRDFNRRFNLLTHLKTHDSNRPRPFTCPNCAATFVRQHDLTRHASVHATTKPHKCPGCETQFSRRDAMLRHVMQRSKCAKAAEKAEKEAVDLINKGSGDLGVTAAAAGLSRGRGRRRKSGGLSIQKTEIQLLHEDPEAKKVIDEAFRMQKELMKKNK